MRVWIYSYAERPTIKFVEKVIFLLFLFNLLCGVAFDFVWFQFLILILSFGCIFFLSFVSVEFLYARKLDINGLLCFRMGTKRSGFLCCFHYANYKFCDIVCHSYLKNRTKYFIMVKRSLLEHSFKLKHFRYGALWSLSSLLTTRSHRWRSSFMET